MSGSEPQYPFDSSNVIFLNLSPSVVLEAQAIDEYETLGIARSHRVFVQKNVASSNELHNFELDLSKHAKVTDLSEKGKNRTSPRTIPNYS